MKRIFALLATAMVVQPVIAETEQGLFSDIDKVLSQIESMSAEAEQSSNPIIPPMIMDTEDNSTPTKEATTGPSPTDFIQQAIDRTLGREASSDPVMRTRLTELPPNTRFEFQQNLFIPAHKSGIMFIDGVPQYSIDGQVDVNEAFDAIDGGKVACALLSDKSYLRINGKSPEKRTYVEVSGVSFKEYPAGEQSKILSNIQFKPKNARETADSVSIHISCRTYSNNAVRQFSLNDINKGFGGLFEFKLPRYIEI